MDSPSRWITPRRNLGARTAAALLAALLLATPSAGEDARTDAPAMTNEDVVRMSAAGMPPEEIIRRIEQAPVTRFELDPEMVVELRRAGVVQTVIDAMKRRPAAPSSPAPPAPAPAAALSAIDLRFDRAAGPDPALGSAILPARDERGRALRLAFFITCIDPLHVPDHWDTKSPLARGGAFPRHHLVWFHEDTRPWRTRRRIPYVYLSLPGEPVRLDIEPATHPIKLGVAAAAGDEPFVPIVTSTISLEVPPAGSVRLVLRLEPRAGVSATRRAGEALVTLQVVEAAPVPASR